MATAMNGPKFYAVDNNGKPLAYGKVYTYLSGTNGNKATYQDEGKLVANTNPVILNGEGYGDIYLDGSYKIVLNDQYDDPIWTSDPVSSVLTALDFPSYDLTAIALSLNTPKSNVSNSLAGTTLVGYFYAADQQVTYWTPSAVSVAETIVSVINNTLTTNAASYTLAKDGKTLNIETVANMISLPNFIGSRVRWDGYHTRSDGGSNWGIITSGAHTADGGSIFSLDNNTYIKANLKGKSVSVSKFGTTGGGTVDDYLSMQTTINWSLTQNQFVSTITSYRSPIVSIPAGRFRITQGLTASTATGGSLNESQSLTIKGSGTLATEILNESGTYYLDLPIGVFDVSGMTVNCTSNSSGLKLGSLNGSQSTPTAVVYQSAFKRLSVLRAVTAYDVFFAWDCTFTDISAYSTQTGGKCLHIRGEISDNSNNLTFIRPHFEGLVSGTMIKIDPCTAAEQRSGKFVFINPHLETRSFDTVCFDADGADEIEFYKPNFIHNNTPNGVDAGLTDLDMVNMVKLKDSHAINFKGGTITTFGHNYPEKLLKLSGTTTHCSFDRTYFATPTISTANTIDALVDSTAMTGDVNLLSIDFIDVQNKNFNNVLLTNNNRLASSSSFQALQRTNNTKRTIETFFTNQSEFGSISLSNPINSVDVYGGHSDGVAELIANGGSRTYPIDINTGNNANGPAIITFFADAPADVGAVVFKRGVVIYGTSLGANVEISSTPAAGNIGILATNNASFTIYNNFGDARYFTVSVVKAN
jgi:hypothetical protein